MAITRKLRQKVRDGSLREMWQEMKWIFAYIRRYRAAVGIHILLGILGTALSLLSSVAMKTLIDVVTGFETGAIWSAAAWMAGLLLGSAAWRMSLYVSAYGLSFKRCMTYWGMAVMAALYPAGPAPMTAMSIMRQPPPGQGEPRARAA